MQVDFHMGIFQKIEVCFVYNTFAWISYKLNILILNQIERENQLSQDMQKLPFQSTFLPAETSLLSSIQRAKQRIFSKSLRQKTQNQSCENNNDENNPLKANLIAESSLKKLEEISKRKVSLQQIKQSKQSAITGNNILRKYATKEEVKQNTVRDRIQVNKERIGKKIQEKKEDIQKNQVINSINSHNLGSPDSSNNGTNNNSLVAVNAIRLLQQKISQLQNKNKNLEFQLQQQSTQIVENKKNYQEQQPQQKNLPSTIQKSLQQQSELKSYLILKQQCESLQKQNTELYQQLSKRKQPYYYGRQQKYNAKEQQGKKLNFCHEISQNISTVSQNIKQTQRQHELVSISQKTKELQINLSKREEQLAQYKNKLQLQRKKNISILKLHQEEIIKNEELTLTITELKSKLKTLENMELNNKRKSSRSNSNYPQQSPIRASIQSKKLSQLQKQVTHLQNQLQQEKQESLKKDKQFQQLERTYTEVKQSFLELYKDLSKYHPEVITTSIKFLYEKIKKSSSMLLKSRSLLQRSKWNHHLNKLQSTKSIRKNNYQNQDYNRLSEFRSKSGKKGLKMQDLNSSKRSQSKQRTNSKNSNKSISKSNYRSPYAQQNFVLKRRSITNNLKSSRSPKLHNTSTNSSKAKLSQIQKIIKQIKEVSKQIKSIKAEHRNLTVKVGQIDENQQGKMNSDIKKTQQRVNDLIEKYNQKNAHLQQLKIQKDRLALETVPDALL